MANYNERQVTTPEMLIRDRENTLQNLQNLRQYLIDQGQRSVHFSHNNEHFHITYTPSSGNMLDGSPAPQELRLSRTSSENHDNFYFAAMNSKEHFLVDFQGEKVLRIIECDVKKMQSAGVWGGYHTAYMETKYSTKDQTDGLIGAFHTQRRLNNYSIQAQ